MNLSIFNELFSHAKENSFVQNFIKELSNSLSKSDHNLNLKQENSLYQVVDLSRDGAYLKNINNNKVSKETNLSKDILDKIGIDTVLKYTNGNYIIDDKLTQDFFDSLIDIKEYNEIKNKFEKESNILNNDSNTKYQIKSRNSDYSVLTYGSSNDLEIKVPDKLLPFWSKENDFLYYRNGKFNRDV